MIAFPHLNKRLAHRLSICAILASINGDPAKADFNDIRNVGEHLVMEKMTDIRQIADIFQLSYQRADQKMPHHDVFESKPAEKSPFAHCLAKVPSDDIATSALITCDLSEDTNLTTDDIQKAYGEDIELVLASPRAPEDQPNYLAKIFDNGKLSFGYMRDDNKIVRMVAEIKIKN